MGSFLCTFATLLAQNSRAARSGPNCHKRFLEKTNEQKKALRKIQVSPEKSFKNKFASQSNFVLTFSALNEDLRTAKFFP